VKVILIVFPTSKVVCHVDHDNDNIVEGYFFFVRLG